MVQIVHGCVIMFISVFRMLSLTSTTFFVIFFSFLYWQMTTKNNHNEGGQLKYMYTAQAGPPCCFLVWLLGFYFQGYGFKF